MKIKGNNQVPTAKQMISIPLKIVSKIIFFEPFGDANFKNTKIRIMKIDSSIITS